MSNPLKEELKFQFLNSCYYHGKHKDVFLLFSTPLSCHFHKGSKMLQNGFLSVWVFGRCGGWHIESGACKLTSYFSWLNKSHPFSLRLKRLSKKDFKFWTTHSGIKTKHPLQTSCWPQTVFLDILVTEIKSNRRNHSGGLAFKQTGFVQYPC